MWFFQTQFFYTYKFSCIHRYFIFSPNPWKASSFMRVILLWSICIVVNLWIGLKAWDGNSCSALSVNSSDSSVSIMSVDKRKFIMSIIRHNLHIINSFYTGKYTFGMTFVTYLAVLEMRHRQYCLFYYGITSGHVNYLGLWTSCLLIPSACCYSKQVDPIVRFLDIKK